MSPKQAYDDIANRARRLLRLHDGLINTRKKGIRRDWKKAFCRFMRWRVTANIQRVDSADAMVVLRHDAGLEPSDFEADALDDMLRASLTFGVSALDRYVHEVVIKKIVNALKNGNLTKRQEEFCLPAVLAIRITEEVARARRDRKTVRPANAVRKKIQEVLHKKPFQSWREIQYAYELIGITNLDGQLQSAYGSADIKEQKAQLGRIVRKRNFIVHEGDLVRHERGGNVRKNPLARKFVEESLDFLDEFTNKLDCVQ